MAAIMSINGRQLTSLFVCSLVLWTVGYSLTPLLPLYAIHLGADSAVAGYFLTISFLAFALGAITAGWVSVRFHHYKFPLILAGLTGILTTWLMGQVSDVWWLIALTAVIWFISGLGLLLTGILIGLSTGEHDRGKIIGILSLTCGIGALVGCLGTGWLVNRWGFTTTFRVLPIFLAVWPVTALLLEETKINQPGLELTTNQKVPGVWLRFYLLFTASIMSFITGMIILLVRSIMMNNMQFDLLEISRTGAIGALMVIPFPFLMGWLSDRISRRELVLLGYLAGIATIVLLGFSKTLWDFWAGLEFQGIGMGRNAIGIPVLIHQIQRDLLGKVLAVLGPTARIGGVIGFAVAGFALQNLVFLTTLMIGGCLRMMVPIQAEPKKREVEYRFHLIHGLKRRILCRSRSFPSLHPKNCIKEQY